MCWTSWKRGKKLVNLILNNTWIKVFPLKVLYSLTPTFVAPIWPAAGISIGVILLWGYKFIPAIFIAEILKNFEFYDINALESQPELLFTYIIKFIENSNFNTIKVITK